MVWVDPKPVFVVPSPPNVLGAVDAFRNSPVPPGVPNNPVLLVAVLFCPNKPVLFVALVPKPKAGVVPVVEVAGGWPNEPNPVLVPVGLFCPNRFPAPPVAVFVPGC